MKQKTVHNSYNVKGSVKMLNCHAVIFEDGKILRDKATFLFNLRFVMWSKKKKKKKKETFLYMQLIAKLFFTKDH